MPALGTVPVCEVTEEQKMAIQVCSVVVVVCCVVGKKWAEWLRTGGTVRERAVRVLFVPAVSLLSSSFHSAFLLPSGH